LRNFIVLIFIEIFLTRTHEEKRPLGKLRCSFDDNIIMYVKEIGCDVAHWISFA
jgi:hypothetical protein